MPLVCKKLTVLLWKCIILRKRNWLLTVFELISPIWVVLLLWYMNYKLFQGNEKVNFKYIPTSQSSEVRLNSSLRQIYNTWVNITESTYIAYTPNNTFTDKLMRAYKASVEISDPDQELSVEAKISEADVEVAMTEHLLPMSKYSCVLGVVFSKPTKTFKYKIIGNFDDVFNNSSALFKLQVFLDAQYLKSMGVHYEDINILIGELLQSKDESESIDIKSVLMSFCLHIFLTLAYTFLVAAVVRDTIQEKSSGIKELMRIMGLSSWMIWIHWFIYSMFVQIPVTVVITVLLTCIPPHVFEANVFMVWFLLLLVTIDYVVIFFVVTCFFDGPNKATALCIVCWIIINLALLYVIFPNEYSYPIQVLISLIPLINLCWTFQSLHSFHLQNIDWNLSLLFTQGYTGSHIPAGVAIIILICEIIIFTLLLSYFDAVKPGRYGVAKPVTFICGCCVKLFQNNKQAPPSESSSLPSNFELPPPGTKVGIKIRGLHKAFGMFKKVVAVENVNLDIYEGEVTVLLGHNGAGKTTTMSMITGMFSPTSGTVSVDGINIYDRLYDFRQNLGLCTQHNLYFPKLTLIEHLMFFGMLKGRSRSQAREEGIYLLHLLNLLDKKDFRGSMLSGGMLRRLCLAVALTGGPKVLILDEPTSGLDPENRRHIWDLILSLRGERTILITTHYMEEADILGDRIAIMDHGKVVCCGTTMFLKKLYGTGYNIHITKNPKAPLMDIIKCIQSHIPRFDTKEVSPAQIDFTVKDIFVGRFPDLFLALESSMVSLGVTGITISCTTMEDVFLRVAELSEELAHGNPNASHMLKEEYYLVEGISLTVQRVEALVMKQVLYISKHLISTIIKLVIACLLVLSATLLISRQKSEHKMESRNVNDREIDLTIYPNSINPIIYDQSNVKTAKIAQNIIKSVKGEVLMEQFENISQYVNYDKLYQPMDKLLTNMAHKSGGSKKVGLASTFIKNDFLIQYQPVLNPLASTNAANLIANILLKRVHPDRSIEVTGHSLSSKRQNCEKYNILRFMKTVFFLTFFIPCALTIVISDFIPLIIAERVSGFKYQQIIAGVSPLMFWLSKLFFDFCQYIVFISVSLLIILIFGSDILPLHSENMIMLILVLILYGVSFIIFLNVFSYISNSSAVITGLYIVLNLVFMLVCPISLLIMNFRELYIQIIVTAILSLHPSAAAFFSIYSIAIGIANDSICVMGQPVESFLGLPTSTNRNSIFIYVLSLVIDTVLYSIVLILIDCKICARMTYKHSWIDDSQRGDDDVKFETQRVRMFKEAQVNTTPLRVEGLVKNYNSLRAANQVSFLVVWGECFGLLGVNGAGKTTTFKMLTGEITPSSGDAFSTQYSVISQTRKYLSNIGYCPQFDALLNDLTGNNTLTLIAKIRGVPRRQVREQVDYWMTTLGIQEHANKPIKTYSGGTKRKLGTAMAFIGEPIVAMLDEPTTGVDPAARRKVWSAVKDRQSLGYSAMLSSHSMEECEALCSRLTIMREGELCCIGSVEELKTKFGQGYVVLLKIVVAENYTTQLVSLKKEFLRAFPKSVIQDENFNMITYRVLDSKTPLSWLFSEVLRLKKKYRIVEDFIVSNATLEQIFLAIARGQNIHCVNPKDSFRTNTGNRPTGQLK